MKAPELRVRTLGRFQVSRLSVPFLRAMEILQVRTECSSGHSKLFMLSGAKKTIVCGSLYHRKDPYFNVANKRIPDTQPS